MVVRIGIDLGGTKIAGVALGPQDQVLAEGRVKTLKGDYEGIVRSIGNLVLGLKAETTSNATVGAGIPGSISPARDTIQNANSTWLNGRRLKEDLERELGAPVRLANDANCLALSEATDGAAIGARAVFAVIVGTGLGGGLIFDGKIIDGPRSTGGEWGHNPLPWMTGDEFPGRTCWCGKLGCLETWVSGSGLEDDHARVTGERLTGVDIAAAAREGDAAAKLTLERHASRLARGLAHVANIFDPDVIVLGGGLSQMGHLYEVLPGLIAPYLFADDRRVRVLPPRWGDASGVRGAARLW